MIQRGTRASRSLALLIVVGPLALMGGAFGAWAAKRWITDGQRIETAERELHRAAASAEQALLFKPLGDAWEEYAATEISGLWGQGAVEAAEAAAQARLRELFERFDGAALTAETMPVEEEGGLQRLRLETRGELPEAKLAGFLSALEGEPPFLFVDLADIHRQGADAGGPTRLALRLRVSAFRLVEERE